MKNLVISNPKDLEEKIAKLSRGGASKLHVVSDFDRTLTKAFVRNKKVPSLISILRDENYLTPDYPQKAHALFNKYHPIELDTSVSQEEKSNAMHEWWTRHFELLIKSKLNKKDIEKAMGSANIKLRNGVGEMLLSLYDSKIPVVILSSSGLGKESIELCLKGRDLLFDNIHIVSNSFIWDKSGKAVGVMEPIIHTMNKSEASIKNYPEFKEIKSRSNVLLLGDSVYDTKMVDGFDYENIIKIGFLNYEPEENLEKFKKNFDVVILGDNDMYFVEELIKKVV
jgi:5'-nucleotidase